MGFDWWVAMTRCLLVALLSLGFLGFSMFPAKAERRLALVIGNGAYVNANKLLNPPNDARAMAASLKSLGFEVMLGVDLQHDNMTRLLHDFLVRANGAQIALLFYAGHGLQVDGRTYLVPVDAKIETLPDLNFAAIELDQVLASLDDPARANLIFLDACRDNPFTRSFASRTRTANAVAGLAAYTSLGTGTLVAY